MKTDDLSTKQETEALNKHNVSGWPLIKDLIDICIAIMVAILFCYTAWNHYFNNIEPSVYSAFVLAFLAYSKALNKK